MSDPELFRRYADLLEGDAAELAPLAGQLDTLYTALDPPAHLELAIERAVRARPAQAAAATGTEDARPGNRDTRVHAQTERRTFVKSRHLQTFAACAAAFVVVALMAALLHGFGVGVGRPAGPGPRLDNGQQQQNFDRLGGVYAVVQARCPADAPDCDLAKGIQDTITVLFGRLSRTFDVAEMVIRQNGPDSILIELPGVKSTAQLAPLLNRGALSFLDTGATFVPVGSLVGVCTTSCQPGEYKAVFTGADLDPNSVTAALDPNSGQPVVIFTFEGTARAHFADYTRTHIGQYLTIALDNRIIESATIQSEINGEGQIVGLGTLDVVRKVALYLQRGALPLELTVQVQRVVAPGTPPASGVSCGQGTPLPTPTRERGAAPTATSTIPPTPSATLATIPPTPTAIPARSNGTQPTPAAESGGDGCSTPTVQPASTPTPAATLTPPPTPTVTASPTPGR